MQEKLGLKLPKVELENEFTEAHRKMAIPYLLTSITYYFLASIFIFFFNQPGELSLLLIAAMCWILSLIAVKRAKKVFDIIVLFANGIIIPWVLNIRARGFSQESQSVIFLRGYTYAMCYSLNQQGFTQLWEFIILEIIFIVARVTALESASTHPLIVLLMYEGAVFFMRINNEVVARKNFLEFHASKEALVKFKDLVAILPTSVLIFTSDMKECLFTNTKFSEEFPCGTTASAPSILGHMKLEEESTSSMSNDSTVLPPQGVDLLTKIHNQISTETYESFTMHHNFNYAKNEVVKLQFEVYAFPFLWDGQKSIAVLLNNITHQQEILTLKLANQNKEMAISTVSHELRNPVNGLLGMTQIMEKQTNDPSILKTLNLFKTNINLLLSIINSILDFQQIQANKLHLCIQQVNLEEIFQTVRGLFEFQCTQKSLTINIEISDKFSKEIKTDKERLSQVIINLCANALKFTSKGGIKIFAKPDESDSGRIRIGVSDSGIGIKTTERDKLFTMFGKIDSAGHLNPHGIGLGLLISNCIVKVLNKNEVGYQIQVDSEQGKGSTFWFSLPKDYEGILSDNSFEEEYEIPEEKSDEDGAELLQSIKSSLKFSSLERNNSLLELNDILERPREKRKIIVIVDDNPFNLHVAQKIFEDHGFVTFIAYNGKEAVELAEKLNSEKRYPSLILMDLEMPIMDGVEATQILKEKIRSKNLHDVPIIGLSANDNEGTIKICLNAGMSKYCRKPLVEKDLLTLLKEYALSNTNLL